MATMVNLEASSDSNICSAFSNLMSLCFNLQVSLLQLARPLAVFDKDTVEDNMYANGLKRGNCGTSSLMRMPTKSTDRADTHSQP